MKLPLNGGPATPICEIVGFLRGASWSRDGVIFFATSDRPGKVLLSSMMRIPSSYAIGR